NIVGINCISRSIHRNETSRLLNSIERSSVHHQILYHGKSLGAERFNNNGIAVLEHTHMQLASGNQTIGTVRLAVDLQLTASADSLPTIVIKNHGVITLVY